MNRQKFIEGMKSGVSFTTEEGTEILEKSILKSGTNMKCIVAMEEFAELTQEVSKYLRGEGDRYALLEEMADVYLGLCILGMIFGISDDELQKAIDVKLQREKERL